MKVFERDGYVCHFCGKQLTRVSSTTCQVKPNAQGGDDNIENLVTACLECNCRENGPPLHNPRQS